MKIYKVLGLMSGTSLDGLDLAYCEFWKEGEKWAFKIEETKSIDYDSVRRNELKNTITRAADELLLLHNTYGTWLGKQAKIFIEEKALEVDFICSHGHTTHHQPQNGLTFQIGSGQHLANSSGHPVVCDFRTNDVALGGQGAPLVPIGDRLLFSEYDFCLNLGGISNISFEHKGNRVAYDIGLANMVLNHITQKIGLSYDEDGKLAREGVLNTPLLDALNALAYYRLPFPKSTGYEWFLEKVVPLIDTCSDTVPNLLCTSIHHICEQVALQVKNNGAKPKNTLFVAGGGALNSFMMETLQEKLDTTASVVLTTPTLIAFKEALVFALMGVLRLQNDINVLSSVTGATKDSSSGVVFLPS